MPTLRSEYGELLDNIINDTRSATGGFADLQNFLKQSADVELIQYENLEKNAEMLGLLCGYADTYLESHKGFRATRKGRERYKWVEELRAAVDPFYKNTKLYYQGDREDHLQFEKIVDKDENRKNDMNHLQRLGKLQRSIGTANFVPQKKDFNLKPSRWTRFKNSVSRGLGHLFNGIFGLTTGLVSLTAVAPFTTTGNYEKLANQQESDLTLVPGTKTNEHFEELHPENGPDDQEICADKRRVPITYEELIPEDPNEPPTMTLCFEQGDEGRTVAMGNEEGQGHSFISLKYTKNNPLTGKPERYKCTFGFYPHQNTTEYRAFVAMGTSGLVIPGMVHDDSTHSYSTARTFTVTNKTINTVFKEAEGYAKGGYNFVTRSCATFAHDMAAAAGLPADEYFAKTDFEGSYAGMSKAVSLFAGSRTIGRLGKHAMLRHALDDTTEYARFGQKVINREDIQRLSQRKNNIRLKGYVPSVAAEAARNNRDFHLASNRYVPKVAEAEDANASIWKLSRAQINAENNNLLYTVEKFLRKSDIPREQASSIKEKLGTFLDTNNRILEQYAKTIFYEDYGLAKHERAPLEKRQEAIIDAVKALKDYKEGLDHIFRSSFKADPRLNIPFQHMVSTLQKLDNGLAGLYRHQLQTDYFSSVGLMDDSRVFDYLDSKADNFYPLARLLFSSSSLSVPSQHYGTANRRPETLAGYIKAFGSLEKYAKAQADLRTLETKFGKSSSKYKKAAQENDKKLLAANHFASAFRPLASKTTFSPHDLDFAFRELPEGIRGTNFGEDVADPAAIYQSLILTSYLGGLHDVMENCLKETRENYLEQSKLLQESRNSCSIAEYSKKLYELQTEVKNKVGKAVYDFVGDKLRSCPALDDIINLMRAEKATAKDNNSAPATDSRVLADLTSRLCTDILNPMSNNINRSLAKQAAGDEITERYFSALLGDVFTEETFQHCAGNDRLAGLFREKLTPEVFLSKSEIAAKKEEVNRNLLEYLTQNVKDQKRMQDFDAINELQKKELAELKQLAKDGKSSPNDPAVSDHLSKLLAVDVLSVSITAAQKPLEEPVNEEMISQKAEKMKDDGIFEHLNRSENKTLVDAAIRGDKKSRSQLVKQTMANLRKASFRAAQNSIRENSPSKAPERRPSRRMSVSQKRKSSPDIPE